MVEAAAEVARSWPRWARRPRCPDDRRGAVPLLGEPRAPPAVRWVRRTRVTAAGCRRPRSRGLRRRDGPLQRFVENGRLAIDNNRAENQLRIVAVGRKNWLFAGSLQGAR